jgi:hypothetical protein
MRSGEARVEKRLDHFLVSNSLLDLPFQFRQWIGSGGESDHSPVWFEIEGGPKKPTNPFKFNATWLSDDDFQKIVKENWVGYDQGTGLSTVVSLWLI